MAMAYRWFLCTSAQITSRMARTSGIGWPRMLTSQRAPCPRNGSKSPRCPGRKCPFGAIGTDDWNESHDSAILKNLEDLENRHALTCTSRMIMHRTDTVGRFAALSKPVAVNVLQTPVGALWKLKISHSVFDNADPGLTHPVWLTKECFRAPKSDFSRSH